MASRIFCECARQALNMCVAAVVTLQDERQTVRCIITPLQFLDFEGFPLELKAPSA